MGEFLGEMVEQIKKNEINIGGITGSSEEIKKIRELVLKYSLEEEPVSFQAKLLRFIETKKYIVLGESAEREADVRIVAATNKDLQKAIKTKEFREDLYFRLQVLEIEIPPLRERKQDIKTLVMEMQRFLRGKEIGNDFWEAVYNHDWPGNVRELITVLTRAGILVDSPITGKDIRDSIKAGKSFWETVKAPYLNRDLNRDEVKEIIKRGLDQSDGKYKNLLTLFNLEDNEYKKFMKFLNGNRLNI
jgi:transcriptional regulator with PAS, ATPase and Fis domain